MSFLSLYFHFPFCQKKCPYCHFYVIPPKTIHKQIFLESLHKEWLLQKEKLQGKKVVSIYFGGGTPSLFPEGILQVLDFVLSSCSFSSDLEVTVEANPEWVNLSDWRLFKKSGVNRISLGVQSFHSSCLKTLQREHSSEQAIQAIETAHQSGVFNISIDLMYDLPKQKQKDWEHSLQAATQLPITHISLYNLSIEPHTVFYKYKKQLQKTLPSPTLSLNLRKTAVEHLQNKGFCRYEISAFGKEGYFSRHNLGYWTARPFLGFGPSACSYFEGKRYQNLPHLLRYHRELSQGKPPLAWVDDLPIEGRQKELFCLHLRVLPGAPKENFSFLLQQGSFHKQLHELKQQDLLEETPSHWKLSEKGLLFHDHIASILI